MGVEGRCHNGRWLAPINRGTLVPQERGIAMVTYSELFAYSLVLIGIASLVFQFCKRK